MSLFFFDCVRLPEIVRDGFGLELPHLHAARLHALRMARRMMASASDDKNWRDWTVEISDGSGHRLSVVPFPEGPFRQRPFPVKRWACSAGM